MKYTLNHKEAQFIAGMRMEVGEGEVTDAEAKAIATDPWGSKLIASKKLVFEKAIEIPTKPQLGMSFNGAVRHTNAEKTPIAEKPPVSSSSKKEK